MKTLCVPVDIKDLLALENLNFPGLREAALEMVDDIGLPLEKLQDAPIRQILESIHDFDPDWCLYVKVQEFLSGPDDENLEFVD